jgi:hypothetical protein
MQRETTTTKRCLERIKGSLGSSHCDVEPKYIRSVINVVQDNKEHLPQTSLSVSLLIVEELNEI